MAYVGIGKTLNEEGFQNRIKLLYKAFEIDGRNEACYNLAILYENLGDNEAAHHFSIF
jgi:hypothetical protein